MQTLREVLKSAEAETGQLGVRRGFYEEFGKTRKCRDIHKYFNSKLCINLMGTFEFELLVGEGKHNFVVRNFRLEFREGVAGTASVDGV